MAGNDEFLRLVAGLGAAPSSTSKVVREELVSHLDRTGGELSRVDAERFAVMADCAVRTIRRWQKEHVRGTPEPTPPMRPPIGHDNTVLEQLETCGAAAFRFDDVLVSMMYLVQGNLSELRRLLIEAGYGVPSIPTMWRRWRQLNPMVREGARTGFKHRASKLLHIRHTADAPNEVWEYDGFSLDIHVRAPRGTAVVRPNALVLLDDRSRFIVSHVLIPDAMKGPDVIAAFGAGFEVRPAENGTGVLIGGWPDLIVADNEAAIISGGVRDAVEGLPSNLRICAAYTPTQKGKVERCGQTIQETVVSGMPGRITGSERTNKTHLLHTPSEDLLSWDQIVTRFEQAVYHYNYERTHSGLGGRTPFEVYTDGWSKRQLSDVELAELMVPIARSGGTRRVHPDGIHAFGDRYFVDAALADYIGVDVEVRSWHHRTNRVAVFHAGKFVCMATDSSALTKAQRTEIVASRVAAHREVAHHAAATRTAMSAVGRAVELDGEVDELEVLTRTKAERLAEKDAPVVTATKKRSKAAKPSSRPPKNTTKKNPPKTSTKTDDQTTRQAARRVAEQALEDGQ